ncbi:MAG: hypothetical protein ACLR07_05050 [Christensenellales bacterium]
MRESASAASAMEGVSRVEKDGDRSGSAHARRGKEQHAGKVVLTVVTRGSQRAAHGVKRFHALPGKLALPR